MYGGGEFDENVAFAGGGFISSQATTQAQDSSSSFKQQGESETKNMYGGGEFYGNAAFASGRFMPSQATTQAHVSSSPFKNRTFLPLTLKQLNSVSTNGEATFSIDGVDINTVAIAGRVSRMDNRITQVDFVVDDGTCSVECVRWCHERQEAEEMEAVKLGMYVHLLGQLKIIQGKRSVNVFSIRPLTDLNEIANPLVSGSSINMEESSDVENKIDSAERKLAEATRKSSELEMRLKGLEVGGPERIRDGNLHLAIEAGHLHPRILQADDITGREIERALLEVPLNHPNISLFKHHFAIDLLTSQLEKPLTETPEENNKEIKLTSETKSAEANPLVASFNREESKDVENNAESKLADAIRKTYELETRLKELETSLQEERLSFAKERESHEGILHKQRDYLLALEKELGENEESTMRSRKPRAMDGMMFDDVMIPARSTALKNLPQRFHRSYNSLAVNKVETYLEPWVWEEARRSNRVGKFYLSDDGYFTHLSWQIQEPIVSHRKEHRKLAGPIRNQHSHRICHSYVATDLVSIKRVIRGWEDEFAPLCPWFLSYHVPSDDPTIKPGHRCTENTIEDCLNFVQREGVPKEILDHQVFDCKQRPPSADQRRFKIKSVMNIKTFEEALEELKNQPIGASLIVFPELLPPGKRIYYGPKTKGAQFLGFHAVVMIGVIEMDGELVVVCKLSNGKGAADGGYAYVSLSVVYMVIAADPKEEDRHRATPWPQHLLSNFFYAEIDQAPPNLKRKQQQDHGESSKKPRV